MKFVDEMERLSEKRKFSVKMNKNGEDLREIEGIRYEGFRERKWRKRGKVSKVEKERRWRGTSTVVKNLDCGP